MKLILSYPVRPLFINQKFGETANLEYYKKNGISFTGHNGVDLMAKHGQPVYASHDGIAYPEVDDRQGHGVVIITLNKYDHPIGEAYYKTIYWHLLDNIPVKWGQSVKKGDIIGYADSTGLSTGDHLHWGLKAMYGPNPLESGNINQNNGYMGSLDPLPFCDGTYAYYENKEIAFKRDLTLGSRGDDVRELQAILVELGYISDDCITGFFWFKTLGGVIKYQQSRGISPALGYVGSITRSDLNSQY